jgi:Response regulator of the LytR/AlgR family
MYFSKNKECLQQNAQQFSLVKKCIVTEYFCQIFYLERSWLLLSPRKRNCGRQPKNFMKVNYYQDATLPENRVDVYYQERDAEITELMKFLETAQVIVGRKDQSIKRIFLQEIYYLEIVDRHCFAYLDHEVFQIEYNLKLFLEKYALCGFIQIGKSLVVNLHKIDRIKPDLNMRMHLMMENGEELVLNRAYRKNFMECLKNAREGKR